MKTFLLEIITPERVAFSEEVECVTVPGSDGELGILPKHVPLFASLTLGEVKITQNGKDYFLAIGGGFLEVTPTKTTLLVSRAYKAEDLNKQAILRAKKEAEEALMRKPTGEELRSAQALLRSTLFDLKILRRRHRLEA